MDFIEAGKIALSEIENTLVQVHLAEVEALVRHISSARRIALYGVGREGLMIKALAMRLFHLGLEAHVVGDMNTPNIETEDLLIVSAGPGMFSTVDSLVGVAQSAGAKTACFTAQPKKLPQSIDLVLCLPAQTMANDLSPEKTAETKSVLPMGSLYEGVLYVACEILVLQLQQHLSVDSMNMRDRHTNLE